MNAIIQINDTNTTLNMQSNRNFLPGFNKKLIGSKDKRPIVIAKGLEYQTAISNFKNLQQLSFIEIISLENKINNNPKAVKLVCKNFTTIQERINKYIFLDNISYNIQPNINIMQCKKCKKYGHLQFSCSNNQICEKCGDTEHINQCKSAYNCANCRSDKHSSTD